MKRLIIFIFLFMLMMAKVCFGQNVVLDEETKAICNKVMLNIYHDILSAKDKYPELAQFDEKVMYENQQGIYAIVYQYQPPVPSWAEKDPFEFGLTITTKDNTIFQDHGGYAFNLEFPFLGLKFAGYTKKGLKRKYNISGPINKHGELLAEQQQKYIPLQLQLVADKAEYKIKEHIQFQVELKNVSKKHMWVKNLQENTLYCLFNKRSWGTEAMQSSSETKIILKSGESLKRTFVGEGLTGPQDVEIYCSYNMSLNGVKPAGVLRVRVIK